MKFRNFPHINQPHQILLIYFENVSYNIMAMHNMFQFARDNNLESTEKSKLRFMWMLFASHSQVCGILINLKLKWQLNLKEKHL